MTSRDYDVIFVTSQYSKSTHSETRTRINYPRETFKHALNENIVLKIFIAHSDNNCTMEKKHTRDRTPTEIQLFFMDKSSSFGN